MPAFRWIPPNFKCHQHPLLVLLLAALALYLATVAVDEPAARAAGARGGTSLRIVSLAPALTEMLFALGLGGSVVGVSAYSDFPAAAKKLPIVGDALHVDDERVIALRPTLIVAAEGDSAALERVGKLAGARTLLLPTRHVTDIWTNMRALGVAAGQASRANALTARLTARVKAIAARAGKARPAVFYMVWDQPLMTAGRDSYLNDLIGLAGGRNVTASLAGSYPTFSWEALLAANPDVVLAPLTMKVRLVGIADRYPTLTAVRTHRIRTLPDDIVSRPGPRVAEALEAVERALAPTPN